MADIAAVVPYKIYPYNSGGQKSIALFYQFFSEKKSVYLICTAHNEKPAEANYTLAPLLGTSVLRYINPLLFFRLKSLIKKQQLKVLIFEHPYFGWLAYLLKKSTGVKIIVHSHNIEGQRFKGLGKWWWPVLSRYEMWTYSIADKVFFIQKNDLGYSVAKAHLPAAKTTVITYGIPWSEAPDRTVKAAAQTRLRSQHTIPPGETILFFNGAFDYQPNLDALETIISTIEPELQRIKSFRYKIIICGRGIPQSIHTRKGENIILVGFAEDISIYYLGADIFINPVVDGGGIKTKLVEALAYDLTSVSTINGAIGVEKEICNGKLLITANDNWKDFANAITEATNIQSSINNNFFDCFYWGNIVEKALTKIQELVSNI